MTDNIKPTVQEKSAWAKVPQAFNDWWNGDYSDESNPFRINSAAYWAWAGWSEAVRLNAQAVPDGWKLVPVQATPDMCKASVIYANGNAVYKNVAHEALEIEESIYSEVYAAMLSAAPAAPRPAQTEPAPDWTPTTENINALPEPVRRYIAELETNCDPAGTVRDLSIARDTIRALEASNRMLRDATPQPSRTAQPLTDEQAASLAKQLGWDTMPERFPLIVRAVEQAHRIGVKNER